MTSHEGRKIQCEGYILITLLFTVENRTPGFLPTLINNWHEFLSSKFQSITGISTYCTVTAQRPDFTEPLGMLIFATLE